MARYALVIGISQYEEPFEILSKAITDATAVAELLKRDKRYKNVEILLGEVTTAKLGEALKTFLQKQAVKNEALIYFTGHGFTVVDGFGGTTGYLATSDCSVTVKDSQIIGQAGGLPLNTLNNLIHTSDLSNLVVLLDACHSGAFLEQDLVEQSFKAFGSRTDYYLITGCRDFEQGLAKKREQYSVFTGALLGGLSQTNADEYGKVTGDRLFDFIYTELHSSKQEPIRMGIGRSIVLLEYPSKTKPVTAILDEKGGVICPYQGLQAFDREQKELFFGRKRLVEAIKQKLDKTPFVPVIGASGSGKSSVVRAGLIPWLEEEGNWQVLEPIKPGSKPLSKLRGAFESFFKGKDERQLDAFIEDKDKHPKGLTNIIERLPNSERFLLVVDQFEEVFTVCANEEERQRFIELIAQVTEISACRLAVVTTMRSDFLEPCLRYLTLRQQLQDQAVLMPPLSGVDLKDAITEPARRQGYTLEEELVFKILEDVGKEPGFLPLLEFALTMLWQKPDREKHLLTLEEYSKMGGLTGALDFHAKQVYRYRNFESDSPNDERDEKEQEWIKRIFLRLVRTGEQEKDTRQRQPKANLLSIAGDSPEEREALSELIDGEGGLVQGRLLVAGKDKDEAEWIDLAHEALIEGWQQFAQWRREHRDLRRLRDRLSDALREWQKNPKDENLMMGGLLAAVQESWEALQPYLHSPEADKEFYRRSQELQEQQEREDKQQKKQAIEGETKALISLAEAQLLTNDQLGALFAAVKAAIRLKQENWLPDELSTQATEVLQQAVYGVQEFNRLEEDDPIYCVRFSPDGKIIATANGGKTIKLWHSNGIPLMTLVGHTGDIRNIAFSSDSRMVASASEDETIRVWVIEEQQTYTLKYTFKGHDRVINWVNFSLDDTTLASASDDGTVKLWNLTNGELIRTIPSHSGSARAVSFSLVEPIIASGGWDQPPWQGKIRFWKLDGTLLSTFNVDTGVLRSIQFSTNGKMIICAGDNGQVMLLQISDGLVLSNIKAHDDWVMDASISPDCRIIASVSTDKTVKLWSVDGRLQKILNGHNDSIYSVAFSPNGKTLATASADRTVRFWNVGGPFLKSLDGEPGSAHFCVRFSRRGEMLASASWDGTLQRWVAKLWHPNGELIRTLTEDGHYSSGRDNRITTVEISDDGSLIAAASWSGIVEVWTAAGELVTKFQGHGKPVEDAITYDERSCVNGVSFSPKGELLASGGYDRHVRFWNLKGEQLRIIPNAHFEGIYRLCFSPDGEIVATASWDRTVRLWSVDNGELLKTLSGHSNWLYGLHFSPDGQMLASASLDRTVKLWSIKNGLIRTLTGHSNGVHDVCFSPDGKLIASAAFDNTVRLWSIDGTLLKTLTGHNGGVYGVSFSYPGGQIIASASWDGSIKLWSTEVLDFDGLVIRGCSMLQNYLKTNPNISQQDRNLCDGFVKVDSTPEAI